MKAKNKKVANEVSVDYSIPLLSFMKGKSTEEGLILQIHRVDKKFRTFTEEFIPKIPDNGVGVINRQVEEYWPARNGDRNLLSALKSLALTGFQLADFRTAVAYLRQNAKSVYSSPYPQFKTYFQVGDKLHDLLFGMWPDSMNQRMDGPGISFGESKALVSEIFDEDDVLLVVPIQDEPQITIPEHPEEEFLVGGEAILRATINTYYGSQPFNFVRIMQDFCRVNRLGERFATVGPANPNEVLCSDKQKGSVKNEVIEFWFPQEEGNISFVDVNITISIVLPELTGSKWKLAVPHDLISYLRAYPEKIGLQNFCTHYQGLHGGEALMKVGRWERGQVTPGVALIEIDSELGPHQIVLPSDFHFLAVKER